MRRLKYHVACTADGFIVKEDHIVEGFLNGGEHSTDYQESLKNDYDIALMGRKIYEFGLQFDVTSPYPWLKQYVISSSMEESPDPDVELVSGEVISFVKQLKEDSGKDIYLCGGAQLAGSLFAEDLIDDLILKVNPVTFGSGIPLFEGIEKQIELTLEAHKIYDNGVALMHYQL